jgi:TldD protein
MNKVDGAFLALPYERLSEVALSEMRELKCSYGDFRFERLKGQMIQARDANVERVTNSDSVGYGVRVIYEGSWGFASSYDLSEAAVRETARRAVAVAKQLGKLNMEPVQQADEPVYKGTHVSSYKLNPFEVPDAEKIAFLLKVNQTVLDTKKAQHVEFALNQVLENKFFASTEGTQTTQQRVRLHGNFDAVRVDPATGAFETMRSLGVPVGQGWEYMTEGYDYLAAARETPELLEQKMLSRSVEPGRYDLVLHPTNMWLTIHESIGHATEFDRVLGYEANYAGTSFATLDKLNKLQYGSKIMHVTGDRNVEHGLATVGWDDEGVEGQKWDLIKDGTLVGYQLNRQMALKRGLRSNGCAFADSPAHVPIQRMANVSLAPAQEDVSLDDLIGKVDKGIYIMGDKSWSIDMQRYNFQFTGQRIFEIKNGKVVGQLKDVAYQGVTTEFWNSMEAVGGPKTYLLGGAFNCGKGQPGQVAPVSHGAPVAMFRNINILNTTKEGAK